MKLSGKNNNHITHKILSILAVAIFIVVVLSLNSCASCNEEAKTPVQELTVGIQNSPSNSLIIIAYKKGFFDTTKVKVVIQEFSAGKLALQALLGEANDLDVAVSAETPIALSSLGGNKIKVISQIVDAKNECRVVVRKDGDLSTPEEYFDKIRKLATSEGGSPEWLTYNFIKHFELEQSPIEIVAMLPENMPVALSTNSVDGISIFDPYARIAENELGDNALTFYNSDITSFYVMSVKENTITTKSEALEELIKGLLKAQEFIEENPDEAKKIVAEQTKLDIAILDETWSNYSFAVGLSTSLVDLLGAQSTWAIETGKYPSGTTIPDYNQIVYPEILKKVAPDAIDL